MENEIWKDIPGYENHYQVSNLGRVKSLSRNVSHYRGGDKLLKEKILSPNISGCGYYVIKLSKNGKYKTLKIHRIIAMKFIQGSFNGAVVNHINGIKTDNRIENLEWCTRKENDIHAKESGLLKPPIKSVVNTKTNKKFNSLTDCAKFYGLSVTYICAMLNGRSTNKYNLKYK